MASIEDAVREILKDLKELKSETRELREGNRELHSRMSSFEGHHSRASSFESTVPRQVHFEPASSPSSSSANTHVMVVSEVDNAEQRPPSIESNSDQSYYVNLFQNCDSGSDQKSNHSQNSDSESDQKSNHSQSSDSEFSEFANFQQQYENENLSQQELEDLWEQFNSHRIHESEENFSSSEQQEEQENELENYSNADENESLDPGGCQSPFSEANEISADY
jgi:hypothetical protein